MKLPAKKSEIYIRVSTRHLIHRLDPKAFGQAHKKMLTIEITLLCLTLAAVQGQKVIYESCPNSFTTPEPAQGPQYDCLPREVLIELDLPREYHHVSPDHVSVKRCGGSCHFDRYVENHSFKVRKHFAVVYFTLTFVSPAQN